MVLPDNQVESPNSVLINEMFEISSNESDFDANAHPNDEEVNRDNVVILQSPNEEAITRELEANSLGSGAKLMRIQLLQLELRLGKTPSMSFRPVKTAKSFWQFGASCSFRVSLAHDGSWSKWEPSLWLCG
ncbi:hypothetical protein Tco_0800346 [Tanacetum coccineum]|uniref:Uncharacterized protein n=1 Tax=Tanacetum coccineum TaxID=301880 RepID=A0ABQ4ZX33_9ASTR